MEKSKTDNDWLHIRSVGDLVIKKYLATNKRQITQEDHLFQKDQSRQSQIVLPKDLQATHAHRRQPF